MSLNKLSEDVMSQIKKSISTPLSDSDMSALSEIIEKALVETVNKSTECCTQAVVMCCGPEADLAHKISHEVDQAQQVLITNLMSMR